MVMEVTDGVPRGSLAGIRIRAHWSDSGNTAKEPERNGFSQARATKVGAGPWQPNCAGRPSVLPAGGPAALTLERLLP